MRKVWFGVIPLALFLLAGCTPDETPQSTEPVPVDQPTATLTTSMGDIVLTLNSEKAPATVDNFLSYARQGTYDGTIFHRVIPGFMIQGGGFDESMDKRPAPATVKNESDNGLSNTRGTIAMARTADPHSASNQFFINLVDNNFLDYGAQGSNSWGYAVFGKVVEGMEVVDQIQSVTTGQSAQYSDVPKTPIIIKSVHVKEPPQ